MDLLRTIRTCGLGGKGYTLIVVNQPLHNLDNIFNNKRISHQTVLKLCREI